MKRCRKHHQGYPLWTRTARSSISTRRGQAVARRAWHLRRRTATPSRPDCSLERAGFDVSAGRFRADSVFAAGTNADIVDMWHPQLDREARRERITHFDKGDGERGGRPPGAVALAGVIEAIGFMPAVGPADRACDQRFHGRRGAHAGFARASRTCFDAAYGYDAVANPKPAGDVIVAFADMAGLKSSQVAMVGDTATISRPDAQGGRRAGRRRAVGDRRRRSLEQLARCCAGFGGRPARLSETGQVKGRALPEFAAQDLADIGLGQLLAELDMLGPLVGGQLVLGELDDLLGGHLVVLLDHEDLGDLARLLVRARRRPATSSTPGCSTTTSSISLG